MSPPRPFTFHNAGWLFLGVLATVLLGFVPSYFPNMAGREVHFSTYTHVHATLMATWLVLLCVQPFLIKHGHHAWHRRLGRVSFVLLPMVLVAGLLLTHHRLDIVSDVPKSVRFYMVFKDLVVIGTTYTLAMFHRRNAAYHARFMVGSCFQLLEPGLFRAIFVFLPLPNPFIGLFVTWLVIDGILVYLVVQDRHLAKGKWIFRFVLSLTLFIQVFLLAGGPVQPWFVRFVDWFAALPLT